MPDKIDITEKNLLKLNKLFSLMDESSLTKEDFIESFRKVIEYVKSIEEKNIEEVKLLKSTYDAFLQKSKEAHFNTLGEVETIKDDFQGQLNLLLEKHASKLDEIDLKMSEIHSGIDADEARVEENVFNRLNENIKIPTIDEIEKDLPRLGKPIRDALELLPDGEKLKIEAIENLREELDRLKNEAKLGGGTQTGFNAGALQIHMIDDETPTGTKNGVNKTFTLNLPPSPSSSLKVYRGGARQRITEDYTLSGQTITFSVAPAAGEILLCDYRV